MAAPTEEQLATLRTMVADYSQVDDRCAQLNAQIAALRRERTDLENQIAAIISEPAFATVKKLEHQNSTLTITRPGWVAPISLTQGSIFQILRNYFAITPQRELNIEALIEYFRNETRQRATKNTTKIERRVRD